MGKEKSTTVQIIAKLRKMEVLSGQGKTIAEAAVKRRYQINTY